MLLAALVAAALVCALGASLAVAASSAKTTLTIEFAPGGLSGSVSSQQPGCTGKRMVVVYRQQGRKQDPKSDQRVGSDRSDGWQAGHGWSVKQGGTGRYYAVVDARKGCAAARSRTVRTPAVGSGAGDRTDYPICGPYVSEGTTEVCRLDQLHLHLEPDQECKFFLFAESSCRGTTTAGLFPWGETGEAKRPAIRFGWRPDGDRRRITFQAFRGTVSGVGIGTIEGTVPNAGSPRLSVDEAFAQNDQGYPNGDRFYTPNLPGQGPGEPGGPLAINFQAYGGGIGGEVDIYGYLYLKL